MDSTRIGSGLQRAESSSCFCLSFVIEDYQGKSFAIWTESDQDSPAASQRFGFAKSAQFE